MGYEKLGLYWNRLFLNTYTAYSPHVSMLDVSHIVHFFTQHQKNFKERQAVKK